MVNVGLVPSGSGQYHLPSMPPPEPGEPCCTEGDERDLPASSPWVSAADLTSRLTRLDVPLRGCEFDNGGDDPSILIECRYLARRTCPNVAILHVLGGLESIQSDENVRKVRGRRKENLGVTTIRSVPAPCPGHPVLTRRRVGAGSLEVWVYCWSTVRDFLLSIVDMLYNNCVGTLRILRWQIPAVHWVLQAVGSDVVSPRTRKCPSSRHRRFFCIVKNSQLPDGECQSDLGRRSGRNAGAPSGI